MALKKLQKPKAKTTKSKPKAKPKAKPKKKTETKPKAKAPPKPRKKKKKIVHYVSCKVLLQQIRDYYEMDESVTIPNELGENVYKIAKGLSFAPNFINYSYKDDMIGDAIVKMFSALQQHKFKVDSGYNPEL